MGRGGTGPDRDRAGTGSSFKCAYIIINVFLAAVVVVVVRSALNVSTLRVFAECETTTTSAAATRESSRQEHTPKITL